MIEKTECTLEVYLDGLWYPAATLELTGDVSSGAASKSRILYILKHAIATLDRKDAAALSATLPVSLDVLRLDSWPAFAVDLLPQGYGRQELARRLSITPGISGSDWPLLLAGAGNPIGNLRVAEAAAYIKNQKSTLSKGFTQKEIVERSDHFMEYLSAEGYFVAGSSGVQGEWPKILLTQDKVGLWHLDHLLPDDCASKHWIVKFSRTDGDVFRTILEAEYGYSLVAGDLGLAIAGDHIYENGVLFIPRFDRAVTQGRVLRIGQESLYSLAEKPGFDVCMTHNQACFAMAKHCTDPEHDIMEYLLRDVVNIAMGNKDNHGRNTAFQRFENGRVSLSPLFDFAPMFLHPDGIARRIRWGSDDGGSPIWGAVAEQVALSTNLNARDIRQRLANFADPLSRLPEYMEQRGIDSVIIHRLSHGITSVVEKLQDAAPKEMFDWTNDLSQ